jgi:hypothetical protein
MKPSAALGFCLSRAAARIRDSAPPRLRFHAALPEVVNLLSEAQFGGALAAIGAHMLGSFAATGVGIFTMRAVLRGIG